MALDTGPGATAGGDGHSRPKSRRCRAADVTVAVALLAFTFPVLTLAALAVRLEGPGPVLRRRPHVGADGRVFQLLTFRSTSLPTQDGAPRTTRVGRVLQPPRIDQLPVLFNLLRGDMTLVGPAPVPHHAAGTRSATPTDPPGVTGWAALD